MRNSVAARPLPPAAGSNSKTWVHVSLGGAGATPVVASDFATRLGLPFMVLAGREIPREVLDIIPADVALDCHCLPLALDGNSLRVASSNPADVETLHLVQFLTGKRVLVEAADPLDMERTLQLHYSDSVAEAAFQQLDVDKAAPAERSHEQMSALRHRASNIHIRPSQIEGESVVIRLLDSGIAIKSISNLGLTAVGLARFTGVLERGMVLLTGPTGSSRGAAWPMNCWSSRPKFAARSPAVPMARRSTHWPSRRAGCRSASTRFGLLAPA